MAPLVEARSALLYVETDLPEIHAKRQAIQQGLGPGAADAPPGRCLFAAADMLSSDDVDRVAALLRPDEPVAIVHEGIFHYRLAGEKQVAAANLARILHRFGVCG